MVFASSVYIYILHGVSTGYRMLWDNKNREIRTREQCCNFGGAVVSPSRADSVFVLVKHGMAFAHEEVNLLGRVGRLPLD